MERTNETERDYINQARKKAHLSNLDGLGFLVLMSTSISGVNLLLSVILFFCYNGLANRPMPALVQLATGRTIRVATLNDKERTPQVIKDFVGISMTKMMTWRNFLPPKTAEEITRPLIDPGVPISAAGAGSRSGKVATSAWKASFALSGDFQNSFLLQLSDLANKVSAAGAETTLEILNLGEPIPVKDGSWKVQMVANLVVIQKGTTLPKRLNFNKDIYVQAIPVPKIVDGGKVGEQELSEISAEARSSGMQIYAISDFVKQNIQPTIQSTPVIK